MEAAAKQQVVERVKQAQNILVTVSTNPSVDQLAACIGLTLLLNKMGKHATAVFSGKIPPILEFLQPNKTIEHNTDSLRDFIISLDKEKADKLRYKVEDQVVKIFITPYHTSLTENDLVFSQGDFNVEVVMALGVKDKTQVDAAITAHGRILHDSTVISVNTGNTKAADIGQINWQEPTSSSLSEMLVSVSEAFGTGLIDGQIATAFLTGIVSETKRFSNNKTSPKVMTMSAQLMAAGANQMLIINKLEPPVPLVAPTAAGPKSSFQGRPEGTLSVNHDKTPGTQESSETVSAEIHIDKEGNIIRPATPVPAGNTPPPAPIAEPAAAPETPTAPVAEPTPVPAAPEESAAVLPVPEAAPEPTPAPEPVPPPETEPATAVKPADEPQVAGHRLLDPTAGAPAMGAAFTANTSTDGNSEENVPDPFAEPDAEPAPDGFLNHSVASVVPPSETAPEPPHVESARNAVDSAFAAAPFDPALSPVQSLNAAPLGEEIHPPENQPAQNDIAPPAPPPVPPPLMPSPGVVIPTQPFNPTNNVSQTNGS